jgi:hypothetical protein
MVAGVPTTAAAVTADASGTQIDVGVGERRPRKAVG